MAASSIPESAPHNEPENRIGDFDASVWAIVEAIDTGGLTAAAYAAKAAKSGEEMAKPDTGTVEDKLSVFATIGGEADPEAARQLFGLIEKISQMGRPYLTGKEASDDIHPHPKTFRLRMLDIKTKELAKAVVAEKAGIEPGQPALFDLQLSVNEEAAVETQAKDASWRILNSYLTTFANNAYRAQGDADRLEELAELASHDAQLEEKDKKFIGNKVYMLIGAATEQDGQGFAYEQAMLVFADDVLTNGDEAWARWAHVAARYRTQVARHFWDKRHDQWFAYLKASHKLETESIDEIR